MKKSLLIFILSGLFPVTSWGWGKIGHRVVGEIGHRHLNKKALMQVKKILGQDRLPDVANWPDYMRAMSKTNGHEKYKTWHYVSIPDGGSYKNSKKNPKGDVIMGLRHFEKVLKNKKSSLAEKQLALKYFVHMVGDIHQPLHVGRKEDKGGNTIMVRWFGTPTNLHKVWDEKIIELQRLSYTEYSNYLDRLSPAEIKKAQKANIMDWVREGQKMRNQVYDFKQAHYWEYRYDHKNIHALNKRMQLAGYRLAGKLNKIFGDY